MEVVQLPLYQGPTILIYVLGLQCKCYVIFVSDADPGVKNQEQQPERPSSTTESTKGVTPATLLGL